MVAKIKKLITKLNCCNIHIPTLSLCKRSGSNAKKTTSRKQLKHVNESKRVGPSLSTSIHAINYTGSDDSSLTSTDVSSCDTSSPTPCTTKGQLLMNDKSVDDTSTTCSSWFPATPRDVTRLDPFEQYADDYSITSAKNRKLRHSNEGRATPRGISRLDPLKSYHLGEQEFILPTMIVAPSMYGSPLSPPSTVFDRPTIVNGSVSRSSTGSKSLSSTPLSCNQSKKFNSSLGFDLDDSSSAGGSRKSLLHYSFLGSDNIDRLMRRSTSDDERSLPSVQSMPSHISGLGVTSPNYRRATNTVATSKLDDSSQSRIYILLLAPETKQFELLEISDLRLSVMTIGHILDRIPAASTVHTLGSRRYTGLCRPKDGIEMTAQQVPAGKVSGGWRITRGEILIAIPQGFSGQECMKMCCQILLNPKLVKLLQRKDPLAPKTKNSSSSSSCSVSSNRSYPSQKQRCHLQKILEKHDV